MSALPLPAYGVQSGTEELLKRNQSVKLRVGLVLRSAETPRWIEHLLREIAGSSYAEVALVVIDRRNGESGDGSLLFRIWSTFDRRMNSRPGDALSRCDLRPLLEKVPTITLDASRDSFSERVRLAELDVLLALDRGNVPAELSSCARLGVWSVTGSNLIAAREGKAVVETTLCASKENGRTEVIAQSSLARNQISPYLGDTANSWKNAEMILRALRNVQQLGWDCPQTQNRETKPTWKFSNEVSAARVLTQWVGSMTRYKLNCVFRNEHWFIAYRENKGEIPLCAEEMTGFRAIVPQRDRFYADPFLVERDGRSYLFFEDYRYSLKRGLISFVEIRDDGQLGEPEVVLYQPYHLSYPTVFEYKGEHFLIPESADNRTVEMYRALEFPRRWKLEKVLLKDVPAIDPSIFIHEGRIWLFVGGMIQHAPVNDELYLYSTNDLFGEWEAHPRNPVVADVRRARPAGCVFQHDGKLIRPSQDCSDRYGSAVVFNRIGTLSASEYKEEPIGRITAEWYPKNLGTHTFNQSRRYQVVDGRVLVLK